MAGDRVATVGERLPLGVGRFLDGAVGSVQREVVTALPGFERRLGSAGPSLPVCAGCREIPGLSFRLPKRPA
jgi:hypothetical protein